MIRLVRVCCKVEYWKTMPSVCSSWTFGTLLANETGMKPMPIEGSAQRAQAMGWWGKQAFAVKAGIIGVSTTVLLVIIIVPIVLAASSGSDDAAASTITLRPLTYTCTDNTTTPDYSAILAATGSSYHIKPTWEGTLYTKVVASACVTDYATYDTNWPPVTANTSTVPMVPSGVTATPTMWLGPDGYYYLRINGCIAYYYANNNANAWWQGANVVWPIIETDGTVKTDAPVCS